MTDYAIDNGPGYTNIPAPPETHIELDLTHLPNAVAGAVEYAFFAVTKGDEIKHGQYIPLSPNMQIEVPSGNLFHNGCWYEFRMYNHSREFIAGAGGPLDSLEGRVTPLLPL